MLGWGRSAVSVAVVALGCTSPTLAEQSRVDWGYTAGKGPESWGSLSPEFAACRTGHRQSPIDLGATDVPGRDPVVEVDYKPLPLTVLHNGYTVEVLVRNGSRILLDGKEYELLQFHFHTPSEHRVDGRPFAAEMHFVHRAADSTYAVVGLLIEEGQENPALAPVVDNAPSGAAEARTFADVVIDPGKILPPLASFWMYEGSFTTPPCTEGIRWMIERAPAPMSRQHIEGLRKAMGNNARPLQPIDSRTVVTPQ